MSETLWTDGPWIADDDNQNSFDVRNGSASIAIVIKNAVDQKHERANANLIAAAPDLYAALDAIDKSWAETFPEGPDADDSGSVLKMHEDHKAFWRMARAATAKARGEAS